MIFIIPIIAGVIALGSTVLGAGMTLEAMDNIEKAKEIGKEAESNYQEAIKLIEETWAETNRAATIYGELQIRVKTKLIKRFVSYIERIGRKASDGELSFLEGLGNFSPQQIKEFKTEVMEAEEIAGGLVKASITGAGAGTAALGVANAIGTVAVPQLFGLFTTNVAVSQLGMAGVATYLGGGSIALGGTILGGIALGPALLVGGFHLAGKAEEALTQAQEYKSKVNIEIAKIESATALLNQVHTRIKELGSLTRSLEKKALICLDELESSSFDVKRDAAKFQQLFLLVKTVSEIIKTPVLDEQGEIKPLSYSVQLKYSTLKD